MATKTVGPFEFNQSTQQCFYFVQGVDGIILEKDKDIIAAFKNNVCVGAKIWRGPYTDIPAMGDDNEPYTAGYCVTGDVPTFKLYKEAEDKLYKLDPVGATPGWSSLGTPFIGLKYVPVVEDPDEEEELVTTYASAVVDGNTKVFLVNVADAL